PSRHISAVKCGRDDIVEMRIEASRVVRCGGDHFRDIATTDQGSVRRALKGTVPIPWHIHCQPVVWTKVEAKIVDIAAGASRVGRAAETFVGEHAHPLFQVKTLACGGGK